jgi:hypothetical protein
MGRGRGMDVSDSGQGQVTGCGVDGDEPQSSIEDMQFLGQLRNCKLLKKGRRRWR